MKSRKMLAGLVLGSALLVGCEEQADTTTTTPRRTTSPTLPSDTTKSPGTMDRTRDTTPGTPGASGTRDTQNLQARAQTLVEQINQHIRNSDYDAAETALKELESMRSSLPQNLQTQITTLRSSLNAAKRGDTSTPSVPPPSSSNPPPSQPPG